MKNRILFITLCVATLTLSACGKKETPVMSNSVETETIEEETEPIVENEPVTESETETITTEEITETITETDSTIEVDINGVDGTVDEGDYDEEVHGEQTNQPPAQETDEFQQMLEEMAKEIYNSNGDGNSHIAADPSSREELGMTPATDEVTDPDYQHGQTEVPDHLKGGSLE